MGCFLFFLVLWYLCSTHWRKHSNTCQTNDYVYSHQWTISFDVNETKTHSQCRTEIFHRPDLIELSKHATDLGTSAMSRLSRDLHRWFHSIVAQWTCLSRYPASTQVDERHGWISISLLFCSPQAINIKDAYRKSNRENLFQAFDFAQKQYGIAQLIDPEGKMPVLTDNVLKTLVFSRCGHGWTWWEKYFTLCCPSLQSMSHCSQPSISTWTRSSELHRSSYPCLYTLKVGCCGLDLSGGWAVQWIYSSRRWSTAVVESQTRLSQQWKEIQDHRRYRKLSTCSRSHSTGWNAAIHACAPSNAIDRCGSRGKSYHQQRYLSSHCCSNGFRHYNWVNLYNPMSNRLISLGINWRRPWIEWKTIWNNSSSSTRDQKIISIMISIWSNATSLKSNGRSKSKFVTIGSLSVSVLFSSSPNKSIMSRASTVCMRNKCNSIKSWMIVERCHFPLNKFNLLWKGTDEQWTRDMWISMFLSLRMDQLHLRIDRLQVELNSPEPTTKITSPTSSVHNDNNNNNGFHLASKRQVTREKSYANWSCSVRGDNWCEQVSFSFSLSPISLRLDSRLLDQRQPTVIFLRLQFSLIRNSICRSRFIVHYSIHRSRDISLSLYLLNFTREQQPLYVMFN